MIRNYKSKNLSNKLNNEVSVNVIIPTETKKKMMKRRPAEQRMRERKPTQDIPISNIQQTPSNILYGNPAVPLNNPNIPAGVSFPSAQPLTYQNTSYVFNNQPRTSTVSNYSAEIARGIQVPNEEEIQRQTVEVSLSRIEEAQQQQEEQARQNGVLALAEIGRQERRNEERLRERVPSYASIANIDNEREPSPSVEDFNFQDIYNQPMDMPQTPPRRLPTLIERIPIQNPLMERGTEPSSLGTQYSTVSPSPMRDEPIEPISSRQSRIGILRVQNPEPRGRMIDVGGARFNQLIRQGYYYDETTNTLTKKKKLE
jgi:hypothetical protein